MTASASARIGSEPTAEESFESPPPPSIPVSEKPFWETDFFTLIPGSPEPADYSPQGLINAIHRVRNNPTAVKWTPLIESPEIAALAGASNVYFKDESLQERGSYKVRGATNKIKQKIEAGANPSQLAAVAGSHGNHAQGVLMAARANGLPLTILVLPSDAQTQLVKIRGCLDHDTIVVLHGKNLNEAIDKAKEIETHGFIEALPQETQKISGEIDDESIQSILNSNQTAILNFNNFNESISHYAFVHTYDDPRVSMGQGTLVSEIFTDHPHLKNASNNLETTPIFFAGFGGGGLAAGMVYYLGSVAPWIPVVLGHSHLVRSIGRSAENITWSAWPEEIEAKEPLSLADGTNVANIGKETTAQVLGKENVFIVEITEREISEFMVYTMSYPWYKGRPKTLEAAALIQMAAMVNGAGPNLNARDAYGIISGGNVDQKTIDRAHQMSGWVKEHKDFFTFICKVRRTIRHQAREAISKTEDPKQKLQFKWNAEAEMEALDQLLEYPGIREDLMNRFKANDPELTETVLAHLKEVRHDAQMPEENLQEILDLLETPLKEYTPVETRLAVKTTLERMAQKKPPHRRDTAHISTSLKNIVAQLNHERADLKVGYFTVEKLSKAANRFVGAKRPFIKNTRIFAR